MKWFFMVFIFTAISLAAQVEPIDTDGNGFRNVSNLEHLRWISEKSDSITEWYIELDNNINAADTRNWNIGDHDNNPETPDSAMGWKPIGINIKADDNGWGFSDYAVSGEINGNGFVIDSLFINMPGYSFVAFISFSEAFSFYIHDLGITNCHILGGRYTSAFVGHSGGQLMERCFSTGDILGNNSVGGLVSYLFRGKIKDCYSHCDVKFYYNNAYHGTGGGLVGEINIAEVENSYSIGSSLLIENNQNYDPTITECFWDIETSGIPSGRYGTGKTTAEMKTKSTFTDAGWDFDNVWNIADTINNGYPYLTGFDYPTTFQNNKFPFDWIQMPRYRYLELNEGIEKIEVNNRKDSVILVYKNDLQILDIDMDSILVYIDIPENCNEIFLNPDLKTYVMIFEQYYPELNYYEFYNTNTQEMITDAWIKYEGFGQGNNTWSFRCIYPYYNYELKEQKILLGKSESINDTYFTDYSSECVNYYFSRNNRFRLVDSTSTEDFYRKDYSEKHNQNQSFYMLDLLKDTSKNLYTS